MVRYKLERDLPIRYAAPVVSSAIWHQDHTTLWDQLAQVNLGRRF